MAHLKATPKTYQEAVAVLGGRKSIKLGYHAWLEQLGNPTSPLDVIAVRLHATDIVKFWADGQVTLHTGGYRTVTTKDRINEFIAGRVYQKYHRWWYSAGDSSPVVMFTEGMNVGVQKTDPRSDLPSK